MPQTHHVALLEPQRRCHWASRCPHHWKWEEPSSTEANASTMIAANCIDARRGWRHSPRPPSSSSLLLLLPLSLAAASSWPYPCFSSPSYGYGACAFSSRAYDGGGACVSSCACRRLLLHLLPAAAPVPEPTTTIHRLPRAPLLPFDALWTLPFPFLRAQLVPLSKPSYRRQFSASTQSECQRVDCHPPLCVVHRSDATAHASVYDVRACAHSLCVRVCTVQYVGVPSDPA